MTDLFLSNKEEQVDHENEVSWALFFDFILKNKSGEADN